MTEDEVRRAMAGGWSEEEARELLGMVERWEASKPSGKECAAELKEWLKAHPPEPEE